MLTLIFCVFVGILHTSLGEPNLDTAPLTIESVRGKQVILPCVVKNLGFSSIIWFAPSGTAIAKDTHLYVTDNRISMQHEYDSDFHIVIDNVKEGDQGVYICMVMGGMDEKRVTLVVKSPPTIDDQRSSPNAIIIREGETLNLRCSANGKPVPTINWYRSTEKDDGQMVKEDLGTTGAVLSVANIERENSGSYQCVASNGLLPNVSREMIVTVHCICRQCLDQVSPCHTILPDNSVFKTEPTVITLEHVESEESINVQVEDTQTEASDPNHQNTTDISEDLLSASNSQQSTVSQHSNWSDGCEDLKLPKVNTIMKNLNISPLRSQLSTSFDDIKPSTLRYYKRKADESIDNILDLIAPTQGKLLRQELVPTPPDTESSILEMLIEMYTNTEENSLKTQLLSILSTKMTKIQLQTKFPALTSWKIDQARALINKTKLPKFEIPEKKKAHRKKMEQSKIDHAVDFFSDPAFIQLVSFGTKEMSLESGESITIPEVIRTTSHSKIIEMYLSYCKDTDFSPLGKSTLFKILNSCEAKKRSNLHELDNITADGIDAFESLFEITQKLSSTFPAHNYEEINRDIKQAKSYLKADFKIHLEKESLCADHCLNWLLSDPTANNFQTSCDHNHTLKCDRCENLKKIQTTFLDAVEKMPNSDDKDEVRKSLNDALENIHGWKAHIIRTSNQDLFRQHILQNLKRYEGVLVMDWAMKFLPQRHREKQTDWFGQRGKHWHVSVVIYRDEDGEIGHRTFTHVLENVKQDWYAVASLMEHTLNTVKIQLPHVTDIYLRSDNAGCYHCGHLWLTIPKLSDITGINIKQYTYSEAQAGKSYCDSKIAHMRTKMRSYVANGSDILCADDMKTAIDHGSVKPTIYSNDNDIFSKRKGQTVILDCIAEGFPLPAVEWQRNGETIKEAERSRKYRISDDKTMDTVILTLRINDLEDHDFGIYTCLARNMYGQASHDYSVEKTGAPKIEISSPLIRKMKSENAEFECRVRGFPRGVVWFKDGERIIPNRQTSIENYKEDDIYVSSLTVLTLTATEFGIYVCQADNEYGSDEIEIRLEQSAIDVSGPTEASVGGDIAIVCNATTNSVDDDSITWLKNGQPLKTSNRISISRDINVKEQRIYSKLYISDMKIGDKGTYTCKTKNYLLRSHTLSILELPDEFVSIDKEASSPENVIVQGNGDDFELLCEVEAYPRKMVYWLKYLGTREGKEMYQELSSGNEILPLRNEKASAGTYRCRASNGRKAEETLDITVDIQYGVKVSVPTHRIRNIIGMPLSLECNITGNPILWTLWVSPNGPDSAFDHVLDIETHENYVIAAMKVTKMNLEDFGTYTCVGGNHLGNDSTKVAVFPIFPTTTITPKPTTYTMKPIRKTTTEKLVEVQIPKETQTAIPVVKTSTVIADIVSEASTRRPRPTKQSIQTDKDRVRQDDSSGNSVYFSSSCQLLLTLTVFLTFRIIYS